MSTAGDDPVRERRARVGRLTMLGQRVGYALFAVAVVAFVVGVVSGFSAGVVTVVTAALVVGSVVLAPSIVFGFGVRAAEREERRGGPEGAGRRGGPEGAGRRGHEDRAGGGGPGAW